MKNPVTAGGIFAHFCKKLTGVVLSVSAALLLLAAFDLQAKEPLKNREKKYEKRISISAAEHGVDPMLIKAIIFTESTFRPGMVGKDGEIGLMQIRLAAAKDWAKAKGVTPPTKEDMHDPDLNIEIGTWYIARALKRWYDNPDFLRLALAEYNAGRTRLLQWMALFKDDTDKLLEAKPVGKYADKVCRKYVEYTIGNVNWELPPEVQPKIARNNPAF